MTTRTILNREFQHPADEWYPLVRKGYKPGVADDGRNILQVYDDKAINSIFSRFNADAAAGKLSHGNELLIDREHFRHHRDASGQKDKDSLAYGWLKELRISPDGGGLDLKKPWTATGQRAVDGGDYRFFSTEHDETIPGEVWEPVAASEIPLAVRNQYNGWEFLRPLKLTGLTLTNDKNDKNARPLTVMNRNSFAAHSEAAGTMDGSEFGREVSRFVRTYNLNLTDAIETVAWMNRKLADQIGVLVHNRDAMELCSEQKIADRFSVLVTRIKNKQGGLFDDAWRKVSIMEPKLYGEMCRRNSR